MTKIILLLCLFLGIQAEVDPDNAQLKQPICDITIVSEGDKIKFKDFAKKEECLFQRFMDKRQEINCIIQKNDVFNCDDDCKAKITEIGDEIYEDRISDEVRCVCENPRDKPSTTYDEEEDPKISTLDEYIECWTKLWKTMRKKVDDKLLEIQLETNDGDLIEACKKYGNKHDILRCKNYN